MPTSNSTNPSTLVNKSSLDRAGHHLWTPDARGIRLYGSHRLTVRDEHRRTVRDECFHNLVTTAGKNYLLQCGLANATAPITNWFAGMIGENRHVSDGAITSGQAILTSASVAFVAGDAGRQITVFGAGASGANLVTTILSVSNATTAVLAANAGTTVSAALVSVGPLLAVTDAMTAHPGWTEVTATQVQQATRQAWTPGVVSGGSVNDSAAPATYTMSASLPGTVYIHGLFLVSNSTIAGTTGILYSEGAFTQGALGVQANYTVSDTYTVSLS